MPTKRLHLFRANLGTHLPWTRRSHTTILPPPRTLPHDRVHTRTVERGFKANPLGWIHCLWQRLTTARSLGLGAEMAFWLFLSLLPLAAVAGLVTARFTSKNWASMAPLLDSLPEATREMLGTELGQVAAWNGGKVGIAAGLMFVWLASSGVHSIFDGVEIETEAVARPWWKKRLLAIGTCAALSLGIALLALLGTGLGWLWQIVGGSTLFRALQLESSVLGQVIRMVLGAAVSFGLISGLYWVALPPRTRRTMRIVPGALLAMGLQIVIGFGYGLYIKNLGDGSAYQAGLASIGITLMALYLFCLVLLIGVEVNQMLSERRPTAALAP